MSKKFAIIEHNLVTNIAISETALEKNWIDLTSIAQQPGVGWSYINGSFVAPIEEIVPEVKATRHISVGAFFDRFKDQKYPILASTDISVQALIKDSSVRKFIDLDIPQLPFGLQLLVAAGFAIDPLAIINDPIQESENV